MPHAALRQDPITLPALRTLRLRAGACGCPFVNLQTSYWAVPKLENVVVEGGGRAMAFEALWGTFGALLRVVQLELGGKGMWMDDVGEIVNSCPQLEELNFRIGRGGVWSVHSGQCARSLQRLGICVDGDEDCLDARGQEWPVKTWMELADFVGGWKSCPALRQVVLYVRDDVQVVERNPQFQLFRGELASSGRQLLLRSVRT
jgi:hypothetical protein